MRVFVARLLRCPEHATWCDLVVLVGLSALIRILNVALVALPVLLFIGLGAFGAWLRSRGWF